MMVVTNGQEGLGIAFVLDAWNDESLVRLLKSRSVCAGIACKDAVVVSYCLFEDFDEISNAACTSKHHIHKEGVKNWMDEMFG